MIALKTNRRAFIDLADGIRGLRDVAPAARVPIAEVAVEQLKGMDDFNEERFLEHVDSPHAINPRRVAAKLEPGRAPGMERAAVRLSDDEWLFAAYLKPGEDWNGWKVPHFTRFTVNELIKRHQQFENTDLYPTEAQTLAWDEDANLMVIEPDAVADPDSDDGVQLISPDEHGLYRFDIGWTFEHVVSLPALCDVCHERPAETTAMYAPAGDLESQRLVNVCASCHDDYEG